MIPVPKLPWYQFSLRSLLLLTVFRPNLEDRVAMSAVFDLRIRWRRSRPEKPAPPPPAPAGA